jgi:hypothetical protein
MQIAGELRAGFVRAEHPPLEAVAPLAADGGPAALHRAVVGNNAQPALGGDVLMEGEPAENVQVVFTLGEVAPQGTADERVDAIGTYEDIDLDRLAVGHLQPHAGLVLRKAVNGAVNVQ